MAVRQVRPHLIVLGTRRPELAARVSGVCGRASLAAFGAGAGAFAAWATHRGLIDDSYITLSYARNLAEHGHWGLIASETANSATSPLNVFLLAGSMRVVSPFGGASGAVVALGLLTLLLGALLGWWLAQATTRLGISRFWAAVGIAVVLANPFVLSSLGLEVVLLSSLLGGLVAAGLRGRPVGFGVLSGLAVLARLDMIIFVLAVALLAPLVRRRLLLVAAIATAVSLPWFAWSWWVLGSAIPDTFVIKTLQRSFEGRVYLSGLWTYYKPMNAVAVWVHVVPALVGLGVAVALAVRWVRRPASREHGALLGLAFGSVVYYAAYSVIGAPPYQWYYVPPQVALALVGVLGGGLLLRDAASPQLQPAVALGVLVLAPLGLLASLGGRSLPWPYPPIFGNFATPADYRAVGHWLAEAVGQERVAAPPEIGTLAFACECSIVDPFADPALMTPLISQRVEQAGPLMRWLLRVNYARRDTSAEPDPVAYRLLWVKATDPAKTAGPSWPTNSPLLGPGWLVLHDA